MQSADYSGFWRRPLLPQLCAQVFGANNGPVNVRRRISQNTATPDRDLSVLISLSTSQTPPQIINTSATSASKRQESKRKGREGREGREAREAREILTYDCI